MTGCELRFRFKITATVYRSDRNCGLEPTIARPLSLPIERESAILLRFTSKPIWFERVAVRSKIMRGELHAGQIPLGSSW